jgi:hypothetical protein
MRVPPPPGNGTPVSAKNRRTFCTSTSTARRSPLPSTPSITSPTSVWRIAST